MNNCNSCYVKHGPKCPQECSKSKPEPTYREMVEMLTDIVDNDLRSEDETNFVGYFGSRNVSRSISIYYQIKEKMG